MITLDSLKEIFQGITSLFAVDPKFAFARLGLIALGFLLMYLGQKRCAGGADHDPDGLGNGHDQLRR